MFDAMLIFRCMLVCVCVRESIEYNVEHSSNEIKM